MIHIIVTCTKQKYRGPLGFIHRDLSIGSVSTQIGAMENKFHQWMNNLQTVPEVEVTAKDLYKGSHWSAVRDIYGDSGINKRVWVSSAGYGLVDIETKIKPYSATFSLRNTDSVSVNKQGNRDWWKLHNSYSSDCLNPTFQRPYRSVKEVAQKHPDVPILVIASKNYLDAVVDDVNKAKDALDNPRNLAIISSGTHRLAGLEDQLVQCDARFSHIVKGVRRSLNVNIGRYLLEDRIVRDRLDSGGLLSHVLNQSLDRLKVEGLPDLPRYDRQSQTDDEIIDFVTSRLLEDPTATHTKLLRQLRSVHQKQCEQRRFARLFGYVKRNV